LAAETFASSFFDDSTFFDKMEVFFSAAFAIFASRAALIASGSRAASCLAIRASRRD
jgi:hypothetical protein